VVCCGYSTVKTKRGCERKEIYKGALAGGFGWGATRVLIRGLGDRHGQGILGEED